MAIRILLNIVTMLTFTIYTDLALASPGDRTDLYGITLSGKLLHFNKTDGSATLVKQLPTSIKGHTISSFGPLAVNNGVFIANTGLSATHPFISFGANAGDELWIGSVPQFEYYLGSGLYSFAEVPGRALVGTFLSGFVPLNVNLATFAASKDPVVAGGIHSTGCSGSGFPYAMSYYNSTTAYSAYLCGSSVVGILKSEFQNGSWTKTLDLTLPTNCSDSSHPFVSTGTTIAADPGNSGVLYVAHADTGSTTYLQKLSISGSTITCTTLNTVSFGGMTGLAFGPPSSDVPNPRHVSPPSPKSLLPIRMLMGDKF
jgi:hypothetical protein